MHHGWDSAPDAEIQCKGSMIGSTATAGCSTTSIGPMYSAEYSTGTAVWAAVQPSTDRVG